MRNRPAYVFIKFSYLTRKGDAMKAQIHKLLLLLIFSVTAMAAFSVVSEYSFASALGTFTEISGGTIHGTSANDNECF